MASSDVPSTLASLANLSEADLLKLLASLGAAGVIDQSVVLKAQEALKKGLLSSEDLIELLGLSFSGDGNFSGAWKQLVDGVIKGDSSVMESAQELYRKLLKQTKLGGNFDASDILQEGLVGLKNPGKVAGLASGAAKVLAGKHLGNYDKLVSDAPEFVELMAEERYVQAWKSMDGAVIKAIGDNPQAQSIYKLTASVRDNSVKSEALAKKYDGGSLDASGIAAVAGMIVQIVENIISVIRSFVGEDDPTMKEIDEWGTVGGSCVTSIMSGSAAGTAGTIVGALSCAVAVAAKVSTYFQTKPSVGDTEPIATFTPDSIGNESQWSAISIDAARLALLMRTRYGYASYKPFADNLKVDKWMTTDELYPSASEGSKKSIPAMTPKRIMLAMGVSEKEVNRLCRLLANFYTGGAQHNEYNTLRLHNDDLSVRVIDKGAELDRSYDVWPCPLNYDDYARVGSYDNVWPDPGNAFASLFSFSNTYPPSAEALAEWGRAQAGVRASLASNSSWGHDPARRPFMFLAELLSFFEAITLFDLARNPGSLSFWNLKTHGMPVRFHYGKDDITTSYSAYGWTSLPTPIVISRNLVQDVEAKVAGAARELAWIRLMAAWSYLHLVYMWGYEPSKTYSSTAKKTDPLANITVKGTDPAVRLIVPINCRSFFTAPGGGFFFYSPIAEQIADVLLKVDGATKALEKDLLAQLLGDRKAYADGQLTAMISANLSKKLAIPQTGPQAGREQQDSAKDVLSAAIAKGALTTVEGQMARCRAAGGTPRQELVDGKLYIRCDPPQSDIEDVAIGGAAIYGLYRLVRLFF